MVYGKSTGSPSANSTHDADGNPIRLYRDADYNVDALSVGDHVFGSGNLTDYLNNLEDQMGIGDNEDWFYDGPSDEDLGFGNGDGWRDAA